MIILDAHQDIAWNALCYGRDYRKSALLHRRREAGRGYPAAMLGLPDSMLGRVAVIFATLYVSPTYAQRSNTPFTEPTYKDAREAYAAALKELDYYQQLEDEEARLRIIRTQADLDAVLMTWQEGGEMGQRQQGLVILMEGADPIIEPKQFGEWAERGVRIVGTAWQATRYSGGTGMPGGLTHLGYDLLQTMADYGTLLDLSHMAEKAFYEALDRYEGPLIASHSNPRRFRDSDRHLSDDMIRRLAEHDGVMGIVLYNRFLDSMWRRSDPRLPLRVVADAIDYVCQMTGSARHVGIGSNFDGGFGAQSAPEDLETSGDLYLIAHRLKQRGYEDAHIEAIMSGNFLRKLREGLPE